ncbi:MAG: FtsW/RodA/SpoVE family cell cycle protein [Ilumatobacteraceae bacterium]
MGAVMRTFGVSPEVRARRAEVLDRMYGASSNRGGSVGHRRRQPRRRSAAASPARRREDLGPASMVYFAIIVVVSFFVVLGLVMVLSATSASRVGGETSPYGEFQRQVTWAAIGLVAMSIAMKVPYQRLRRYVLPLSVLTAGTMLLPLVPGVGVTINGATSWVRIGPVGFQPSEFAKLASIAFLADFFARHRDRVHQPAHGIIPLMLVIGYTTGVSFYQGDLGSALVLGAVIMAVGLVGAVPFMHLVTLGSSGVLAVVIAVWSEPRRFERITAYRDVEGNKEDLAWQSWQGLVSIANGGMTGSGIGGSNSKLGYLPLAHSDFIFAVIADELGFIGSGAVVGGFAVLVTLGIQTALAAPDRFGALLAGGIAVWFGVQAFVNLGGVANLIPLTGLTLPFFSAGGTSLVVSMIAAGLLLNVARRAVTTSDRSRR